MSTNNSSQTLFRFVSLRNPQLTETEPSKNLGFVHKPKTINSLFEGAIPQGVWDSSNGSKISALENQIPIIESQHSNYFYKTKKEVQNDFSDYFTAAELIAKNKLENIQNYLPANSNEFPANYAKLWDNLIYQVLTQKDFYVKEAILQIIKAVHFNINKNSVSHTELKDAKIVLPGRLFVDAIIDDGIEAGDTPNIFTVNESLISNSYITQDPNFSKVSASAERRLSSYAEKNTELSLAISEKSRLDALKSEIDLISKNYQREYSNALTTAQDSHQAIVKPLLDDYEARLNAVRTTFTSSQTPEEQQALLDAVVYPTLPDFQFSYSALDTDYLKLKLSQPSFETMADVLQREYKGSYISQGTITSTCTERVLPIEGTHTVEELNALISKQQNQYANTIVYATEVPQQEYANIGGALIPIQNKVAQNPFSAALISKENIRWEMFNVKYLYDYDIVLEVPDTSWELEAVECELKDAVGNILKYTPKEFAVDGVKLLVNNIFNDQFSHSEIGGFTEFTAKVYFKNDREGSLVFKLNNPTSDKYFAKLNLVTEKTGKKAFNPKNFGIKRLGVADYLKVVQSVHAYVPGEVSNIENVMASELRHKSISERTTTENTTTTSKLQEVEKMTDTSKVNRSEMQSEVARELDKQQDFQAHANFSKEAIWKIDIGASYANHSAQHESTRQAVTKAQEITERALERVVTKISEERIQKIVHEVQLQNVHEFDNRGKVTATTDPAAARPQHITGVYRWVDKKMKNQVFNYGKRTMFEFMIPEPARLHRLATKSLKTVLTAPIDPRKVVGNKQMKDANVDEQLLQYWANYYGVKIESFLPSTTQVIHSATGVPQTNGDFGVDITHLMIPDNYIAKNSSFSCRASRNRGGGLSGARYSEVYCSNLNGDMVGKSIYGDPNFDESISGLNVAGNVEFKVKGHNVTNYNIKVVVNCEISDSYISNFKKTSFDAIIAVYDQKYKEFQDAQKAADDAAKADEEKNKEKVGAFYREMESNILKHNCIAYLLQDYNGIGKALSTDDNQSMESFSVTIDENLDAYTALSKFLEQAFEWNVMDYTFYPYYWAENKHWKEMYLSEELDPLFRNFLQAGMARVVVTVKPGFEDAVNFYMSTGKIWNGGEVPVIGDPMFLSIADELKAPVGKPQGKYWITTIPTSLTILQAKSAGLEVTDALPVFPEKPEDVANCENPEELVTESPFKLNDIAMLSTPGTTSTIS